jgi:hypothetical protein
LSSTSVFPRGIPEAEIEQRVSDEAAASADVTLVRLWKPPTGARENEAVGLYRAGNEPELDRLVAALPLNQDSPGACSIRNALESTRSAPRIGTRTMTTFPQWRQRTTLPGARM